MLDLLQKGKRILNIDESWFSNCNFQRRKWRLPGTTNSLPDKEIKPRISLIVGIDTEGDTYVTLT